MRKQKIPDWLAGLAVTLFFLFITLSGMFDFTDAIEMKAYDLRARIAATKDRNPDIELVVITDDDQSELGRFPWPRHILAQGIQNLSLSGAKVIALNIPFPEPEKNAGLDAISRLRESCEVSGLAQQEAGVAYYEELSNALVDLDNDAKLCRSLEEAGNVVLPVYFDTLSSGCDQQVPDYIAKHALKQIKGVGLDASLIRLFELKPLLPSFAEAAAGIGHNNLFPDQDGYVRNQAHVVGYLKNTYFSSFPLAIVKVFKGLKDEDITVVLDEGINLRVNPSLLIKVPVNNSQMRTLISWSKGPNVAFHQTPFIEVFKNQIQTSLFRDKIVIIGPTAPGLGDRSVTPLSGDIPGVEIVANSVANILNQRFFVRPHYIPFIEFAVLLFFGVFITWILPKQRTGMGIVTTLGLLVGYGTAGTILFFSSNTWLRIMPPILLLIVGYVLVIANRALITKQTKEIVKVDSSETDKKLGFAFQQEGGFDLALEEFRRLLPEQGVKNRLYNLGLDYEKMGQFKKAIVIYELIIGDGENFKDLYERIPKLKDAEATMAFGSSKDERRPTIGRYEVLGEIGRDSMGVVYRGQDTKTHRTVAINTVRLSEFDEDIIDEIRDRFFRETGYSRLLSHPNIINFYECGEGQDLIYFAMEFLEGEKLRRYIKRGQLLPIRETLGIIGRVADALDYAHSRNVVHQHINSTNIIRIKKTNDIKLTGFGTAWIASYLKTKPDLVSESSFYLSPEQVSGKKVDGRSDVFSLGVILFEMLTGEKPFTGEDMTSLMFKISKEKHPSPKAVNPKIPRVIEKIIDKALEKDLEKRYQTAGQMATRLKKVVTRIDEILAERRNKRA